MVRESQARLEDCRHLSADLRNQLEAAQTAQARAEEERTAVIAVLGWRAKRRLARLP